jgi:hypothetical protein
MAKRQTIHILKNNQTNNGALPSSGVQMGEPLANLYNGILFFSGNPAGNYVQSNNNSGYFEVGSNLYNLELRNQITRYQNISGAGLTGKFLSGTTTGFVLADISAIAGSVDSYTTGATWSPNTLTLSLNQGRPNVPVTINSFSGLNLYGTTNVNGDLTVSGTTNLNGSSFYNKTATASNEIVNYGLLTSYTQTNDVYVTGNTYTSATNDSNNTTFNLLYHGVPLNGPYTLTAKDTFTTGGTYSNSNKIITFANNNSTQYSVDLSSIDVNDTYVTGGTNTSATNNTNSANIGLKYNRDVADGTYSLPYTDSFTTGGTLNSNILSFTKNNGIVYTIDLNTLAPTGTTALDKYVTGFTYNNANVLTIGRNQGLADLTVNIGTLASITVNGDTTVTGTTQTKDLNVTGFVLGNLIPNTGCTYDLGSTTNRWRDAWVNKVKIGTCTTTLEDDNTQFIITVGGTSSGATINLNGGDLNVGGDLLPTNNLNYDLGSAAKKWNTVYADNISSSALTLTNLAVGQVVYVGSSNQLKTETGFNYDETTDRMTVGNLTVTNNSGTTAFIGQGGLVIGSGGSTGTPGVGNLTVHGNFTVFGTGTTVATSELYIEDPQITLNYNPSGSSTVTSIASGIRIQDGSGVASSDVYLTIAQMNTFTGGNTSEYSGPTGYSNRAFLTQLNDIVIRNTNLNNGAPDGVRVLAEFDILDGGQY